MQLCQQVSGCKLKRWMFEDIIIHRPVMMSFDDLEHLFGCRFALGTTLKSQYEMCMLCCYSGVVTHCSVRNTSANTVHWVVLEAWRMSVQRGISCLLLRRSVTRRKLWRLVMSHYCLCVYSEYSVMEVAWGKLLVCWPDVMRQIPLRVLLHKNP